MVDGKMKMTVARPPVHQAGRQGQALGAGLPGTDAAFAMGMTRWILENKKFDANFLACCNKAAATADKELTWSNGAWLVKVDKDGKPGKFLRAQEIGLKAAEKRTDKDGKEFDFEYLVAMQGRQAGGL